MCACILFLSSLIKHFNACSDFQILFASSPSSFSSETLSIIITSCCSRRTVFSHSITRPFHIFVPVAISSVVRRCDTDWKIYRVFVQEVLGMGSSVLKTDTGSSTAISITVCKSSHHLMIEIWILDKLFTLNNPEIYHRLHYSGCLQSTDIFKTLPSRIHLLSFFLFALV